MPGRSRFRMTEYCIGTVPGSALYLFVPDLLTLHSLNTDSRHDMWISLLCRMQFATVQRNHRRSLAACSAGRELILAARGSKPGDRHRACRDVTTKQLRRTQSGPTTRPSSLPLLDGGFCNSTGRAWVTCFISDRSPSVARRNRARRPCCERSRPAPTVEMRGSSVSRTLDFNGPKRTQAPLRSIS
ncbi:hypothetical protein PHSY_002115 [Pseudozyma hubeiensis SY62]|uniref:Uncharacterized protein n=1 Tax=Pseudozyma hubeiensis (strain SY62) TaxID=1305764 RepID=R9P032_PSEHS|nr:hypothetical protein PHSY_002115 [Pseudozyma hubeiensis SY62]GAC94543.1 hypothetical protein PHSY_002115 [Pseudozyma hubeiensis SY62]